MNLVLPLLVLPALLPAPQRIELNAPLPRVPVGDVLDVRVSADERFAVYSADPDGGGTIRLLVASLKAPGIVLDLGAAITGASAEFEITPDDAFVVFLGEVADSGRRELFAVPSDGSALPRLLSGALAAGGNVTGFRITPDARTVVYRADQEVDGRFELYAVPSAGGAPVKVSAGLSAGGSVEEDFVPAPDSAAVFYRVHLSGPHTIDLHRAALAEGTTPVRVNAFHATGKKVQEFELVRAGTVVYLADSLVQGRIELFRARADGAGRPVVLNAPLVPGGDVFEFEIAHGGKRLVYVADQRLLRAKELFAVPLDGSAPPAALHAPLESEGDVQDFAIAPDGAHVAFWIRREARGELELLLAPADGSRPPAFVEAAEADAFSRRFLFTEDGSRFLYTRYGAGLTLVPADGSAPPVRIGPASDDFVVTQDGMSVLLTEAGSLMSIPIDGSGAPFLLWPNKDGPVVFFRDAGAPAVFAVRRCATEEFAHCSTELLAVPLNGVSPAVRVSAPFPLVASIGDVESFQVAADGTRAAFVTKEPESSALFGVRLDGASEAVRIDAGGPKAKWTYLVSPDGEWVVFTAVTGSGDELAVARMDGSTPPVSIATIALPLLVTGDSRRLVFNAWVGSNGMLFGAPLDGSSPPVLLDLRPLPWPTPVAPATADSVHVVYVHDDGLDGSLELYSVRADGSAPPTRLGGSTTPGVDALRLSADGRWAVYRELSGQYWTPTSTSTLSVVPVDGSAPPLVLATAPGGAPYAFNDFEIDPSSRAVVFVVLPIEPYGRGDLFAVPIIGGLPQPLAPASGTVFQFELSTGGDQVVYLDNPHVPPGVVGVLHDVFAVAVDGSAPPLRLNDSPASDALPTPGGIRGVLEVGAGHAVFSVQDQVVAARIDGSASPVPLASAEGNPFAEDIRPLADDRNVVLRLGAPAGGTALFVTSLDGSHGLREVSGPSLATSAVEPGFHVSADGSRVVYRGDLEEDGVVELYMSFVGQKVRRRTAPDGR